MIIYFINIAHKHTYIWNKISNLYSVKLLLIYKACPESIQPHTMKNRHYWRRYKIQEILYVGQWCLSSLQNKHLGTSHSSPNHHQMPCARVFSWLSVMVWNLLLFKGDFGSGKTRGHRTPNMGCWGPGVTWVIWPFSKKLCTRCERALCRMKLPITTWP